MPDFLLELRSEEIPARMQAGARARLHPRRNLLAAQYQQEVAHADHSGNCACHAGVFFPIHASQLPLARSRTRPM